ncbi:hypothetical protein J4Q44_G00321650 [Coregonus suidteri]|uniref:Uncharacterized protein n=1 Tax=Coregonus suidteri TaxID=861788 RepID=A0AAN8KU97_9TELE
MSSLGRKREKHSPFTLKPDPRRKTSAEIVTEIRCSLRTTDSCSGRPPLEPKMLQPPSMFSIYTRNFEAPDSIPGSGTRLSPLEHKPRLPVAQDEEPDPASPKALPKPPSDPLELKRRAAGARARLLRAGSLTTLPPVARVRNRLESIAAGESEDAVERLCNTCDRLHGTLAEQGMLGQHCRSRAGLLKALFCLIDLDSAQLNLQLAKLTLALSVSGNDLLNICKLIFKISRSESNELLFQNNSIIGNSALLRLPLAKDRVSVATLLIQRLHPLARPDHAQFTIAEHILVYSEGKKRCTITTETKISVPTSPGYSVNCPPTLAKTPGCYTLFIELMSKHQRKQDLVVRLLFTLGNLTSRSSEAREHLFTAEGCVSVLLGLYNTYQGRGGPLPYTHPTHLQPGTPVHPAPLLCGGGRRRTCG